MTRAPLSALRRSRRAHRTRLRQYHPWISKVRKHPVGGTAVVTHAFLDARVLRLLAGFQEGRTRQLPLLAGAREIAGRVGSLPELQPRFGMRGSRTVERSAAG